MATNDLDLPFEAGGEGPMLDTDQARLSGGLVVLAATIPTDGGVWPALVFRFATPTGGFYPPIVLATEDEQLAKLRPLINEAIAAARRGARNQGASS